MPYCFLHHLEHYLEMVTTEVNNMITTPIATTIKRLVRDGDCADHWRIHLRDHATRRAHTHNEITINPALADNVIMRVRTASSVKPATKEA